MIGAGHNGLVAANYLADAGDHVVVLEASDRIGGMAATAALLPGAPGHLISPCAVDAVYWNASSVARDLGLSRHGLETVAHDPAWAWAGPGGESLVLQQDVRRTLDEIRRFSARDARTYADLIPAALALLDVQDRYGARDPRHPGWRTMASAARRLRGPKARGLLARLFAGTAAEAIEDLFESEAVRGMLATMASLLGSITTDSGGFGLLATSLLHRYGVVRAVGGMQAIPDALAARLRLRQGTIRTGSPVGRIITGDGACTGVELVAGEQIPADAVVSAVPPQVTAELLSGTGVPGLSRLRRAPANAAGLGCFTLNIALRGQLELPAHARGDSVDLRRPTLFQGTLEQVIAAEQACRRGELPDRPPWTGTILTATDSSQAPPGQDVLYLHGPAPVDPRPGWDSAGPVLSRRLVDAASTVLRGIRELEIARFSESPRDLEDRLGAKNGSICHVDQIATRLGPMRPAVGWGGHRTPVRGLYLSGAGTHPGGGVSGIPGQLAAQAVLADR